jgi:hypothetical protein
MKPYGKFNVVRFMDDGFDEVVSKHHTRAAAVKEAAKLRKESRLDGFTFHSFRVVTAGTLKNAFGLEVIA